MPPGRCGTGVPLDQLHPGDAAEVQRYLAYLADVAARVTAGASHDEARTAAYAEHYPEHAVTVTGQYAVSDDVAKQEDQEMGNS